MRNIKFRVWDKDLKQMHTCGQDVHDSMTFDENNIAQYYNLQNGCGSPTTYELMQYTGLKDKNGKKLYEGDIVSFRFKKDRKELADLIGFIEYQTQYCAFKIVSSPLNGSFRIDDETIIEVIGNVYENPELLKEVK